MGTCHVCRRVISRSDFAAQRAIILLRRPYCRDCSESIAEGRTVVQPEGPVERLTRLVVGRRKP